MEFTIDQAGGGWACLSVVLGFGKTVEFPQSVGPERSRCRLLTMIQKSVKNGINLGPA
jgi:hypothetical protein